MDAESLHILMTVLLAGVVGLIGYLAKTNKERTDRDIETSRQDIKLIWLEIKEFKENYLDRFEKVNTNINASREAILEMFHQLDKRIK